MAANAAAAASSTVSSRSSSTKSLSLACSTTRIALLATFTAWATMWRAIAEQHAEEMQRAVEAAAAWRSRMRNGKPTKTAPDTLLLSSKAEPACEQMTAIQSQVGAVSSKVEPVREQMKAIQLQVDAGTIEEGHAAELQCALDAAAAWRLRMQKAKEPSTVATTRACGVPRATTTKACAHSFEGLMHNSLDGVGKVGVDPSFLVSQQQDNGLGNLLPDSSDGQVHTLSDAHNAELQEALDAATTWRLRFKNKEASRQQEVKNAPLQDESSPEADTNCDSATKKGSPLAAVLRGDMVDSGSTTASGDETSSTSSNSSEESPTCWVQGAYLRDVSQILADGLRPRGHRVRLFAGPWGRSGFCRRNEEVIVYIDVSLARKAGAEFRFSQRGLVLVEGMIPATCCRKMVMIKDGSVLYDRAPSESESA